MSSVDAPPPCLYDRGLGQALQMAGRYAEARPYLRRTVRRSALAAALVAGRSEEAAALYAEGLVLPFWGSVEVTDPGCAALMAQNLMGQRESELFGLTDPGRWSVQGRRSRNDRALNLLALTELADEPRLPAWAIDTFDPWSRTGSSANFNLTMARHPHARAEPLRAQLWIRSLRAGNVELAQEVAGGHLPAPLAIRLPWEGNGHTDWHGFFHHAPYGTDVSRGALDPAVSYAMQSFAVSPHKLADKQRVLAFLLCRGTNPAILPETFVQTLLTEEVVHSKSYGGSRLIQHAVETAGFDGVNRLCSGHGGATPLVWAILTGKTAWTTLLLEKGARLSGEELTRFAEARLPNKALACLRKAHWAQLSLARCLADPLGAAAAWTYGK